MSSHFRVASLFMLAVFWIPLSVTNADVFSYSYGNPYSSVNDGYIVSTNNATLYSEGTVRLWKPVSGGTTFGNTTPAQVTYRFNMAEEISDISLWMNMPTFHWSYSRGHNFLYGSNDGTNWELMAELQPPAFGSARDLGTVNVPQSLKQSTDFWIRADLYSYGSSAPNGGVFTNTAQLSRYDVNANNTSFSIEITTVPEPTSAGLIGMLGSVFFLRRRRA
ncbi:MAG: PEP-CTERM sorting domain-containing protein [Planctomycetota bacterium]